MDRKENGESNSAKGAMGEKEELAKGEPGKGDSGTKESEYEDLDPFEINFLPQFTEGRGPRQPFVNSHGVVIGDHDYDSPNSPLNQWSRDTDPAVMAGDEWVHPFKDIGFQTEENRNLFEKGIFPQGGRFMHPTHDVAFGAWRGNAGEDGEKDGERDAEAGKRAGGNGEGARKK